MGDLLYKAQSCQIKFKMRAVAAFNKIAGFPKISGYKSINEIGPGMLTMTSQFASILDRMTETYTELDETRKICIRESPVATHSVRKEALMVRMKEGFTRHDSSRVMNTLLAVIEENAFLAIDLEAQREIMLKSSETASMINKICSVICFLLGTFQLIQTVGANIKESMWELGVLRSMGLMTD